MLQEIDKKVLGGNIRRYRKSMNLTQADLAALIGLKYQAIQQWEKRETSPRKEHMAKLCIVFRVTDSELLGIEEPKPEINLVGLMNALEWLKSRDSLTQQMVDAIVVMLMSNCQQPKFDDDDEKEARAIRNRIVHGIHKERVDIEALKKKKDD